MFGSDSADAATGTGSGGWNVARRTFMGGVGAATGLGAFAGGAAAQGDQDGGPGGSDATYYVFRRNGRYVVANSLTGGIEFNEAADGNAEAAFQHAFDGLPDGGTVVAGGNTFEFGGPATLGDGVALVGRSGTRFVGSVTGSREALFPREGEDELPTGHDLIRARGDGVAVVGIEFDAGGAQLDNHAVQADDCTGVLIADNRTRNGFQMALSFTGCENVVVRGNEVRDPNWYGITARGAPAGGDLDLKTSSNVVVSGNRVGGMKFNNIATYNVNNFTVSENVTFDGGHSLIACSPAQGGTIVGNVCRDLDRFGGDPGGEAGIEIEYKETHITDEVAGTPAETSFDVTVAGNHVENCGVGFIARTVPANLDDPAVIEEARRTKRPYSFSVTGNTISDCRNAGVRIRSAEDGVIAANTLRNNGTDPEDDETVNGDDQPDNVDVDDEFTEGIQVGLNVTRG